MFSLPSLLFVRVRWLRVAAIVILPVTVLGFLKVPAIHPQGTPAADETRAPVVFSGGHKTDKRDQGRPVALVAAALDVAPEVFRKASSYVHPAVPSSGGPTEEEARANKKALLEVLSRYGVTNERLDEVSNYYRDDLSRGGLWPTKPATAYAVIEDGHVSRYVVTDGGSGYTSVPVITVPGFEHAPHLFVTIGNSKTLEKNGAISSITTYPLK